MSELRRILKKYALSIESTGRGKYPIKVRGLVRGSERQHTYPLRVHGKNPEISWSYLLGIAEEFNFQDDAFSKRPKA
ncbi:MAG: hypothetical protein AUJ92_01675 [Armatimonadetes bacterium CG2_30_59_28]|nr:MAG: hypothetical protein AUJ92_01675 [Armatimonadetes bacterium CG2_30_59_28]PIU66730.1 MAG: hypothetical protein COS85_03560 [Armatimonadetes bacterium CG07_land_8_20_14_0_80_59_28]PIY42453.1 MAG: hypothetical protein COZ05_13825 [Armatimonadetes bacterium CG_4_10_14_3_um_filter_59_10]PJB74067.1 MAG: hypothetical protein CO095_05180 [Armatimonadetes bacterium CG_4_9_14_3_um_filter_58_7]